jgi:FMN phosphatase YigB (HAD superfamily)
VTRKIISLKGREEWQFEQLFLTSVKSWKSHLSFVDAREKEQERYQFEKLVDLINYFHEVGIAKPDRRIFEMTCERLGVQPAEMIFLDDDDNERPLVAARRLGIHAIFFQNTVQAIADIEAVLHAHST